MVAAALACGDQDGGATLVLDQGEIGEVQLEDLGKLVQEQPGDLGGIRGVEQAIREQGGIGLPPGECRPLRPKPRDGSERDGGEDDRDETDQDVAGERLALDQDRDPEDGRGDAERRKDEGAGEAVPAQPTAFAPVVHARSEVERREDDQRHRVEQHRLCLSVHWPSRIIETRMLL